MPTVSGEFHVDALAMADGDGDTVQVYDSISLSMPVC